MSKIGDFIILTSFLFIIFIPYQSSSASPLRNKSPEELISEAISKVVVVECQPSSSESKLGSGFLVDPIGLLVTNAHVVEGCSSVNILSYKSNLSRTSMVLYVDKPKDIAFLYADFLKGSTLLIQSSSSVKPGQRVYTIGHPEGLEYSISDGIVSAVRSFKSGLRLIQITAPISPGSSGGPVLDQKGNVIGMSTLFLSEGQNLNFAIAGDEILKALNRIKSITRRGPPNTNILPSEVNVGPSAEKIAEQARDYRKKKQFSEAHIVLENGAKKYPKNLLILLQKAELAYDEKNFEESEKYVNLMLEVDPNYPPAHQCLSALLAKRGNWNAARQEAEKSLELKPDPEYTAQAHSILFKCALENDNMNAALFHIERVLEFEEYKLKADIHVYHAIVLKNLKRDREADMAAVEALRHDPSNQKLKQLLRKYGLPLGARVISQDASWDILGNLIVKGVVKNEGTQELSFVRVISESIDENGIVVGTGYGYVDPTYLKSGMTGSFEIYVKGNPKKGKRYNSRIGE